MLSHTHSSAAYLKMRICDTGEVDPYDDYPYEVFGESGLLELTSQYESIYGRDESLTPWPDDYVEIMRIQREDSALLPIIEKCLEEGGVADYDHGRYRHRYKLSKWGTLMRRCDDVPLGRTWWQLVVPKKLQATIMRMHHEGLLHIGANRLYSTLRLRYFWLGMKASCHVKTRECIACQLRKAYQRKPRVPIQEYDPSTHPMCRIHIDLTELSESASGMKYILVMKDDLTKYVWLQALKTKNADAVGECLFRLLTDFGFPSKIVSDQGGEFTASAVNELLGYLKIAKVTTSPYNPRSDGLVEQHNKTLKDQLYYLVDVAQKEWDKYLPAAQLYYNTSVSTATGQTPYYMMFGRECAMPSFEHMQEEEPKYGSKDRVHEWARKLSKILKNAWGRGMIRAKKNKSRYVANLQPREEGDDDGNIQKSRKGVIPYEGYKVGQKFFRKRHMKGYFRSGNDEVYKICRKLEPRYDGPHEVVEVLSPVTYLVDINGKIAEMHAVNMKPWVTSDL